MEKEQLITTLSSFKASRGWYNGYHPDQEEKYEELLERCFGEFFKELRDFTANVKSENLENIFRYISTCVGSLSRMKDTINKEVVKWKKEEGRDFNLKMASIQLRYIDRTIGELKGYWQDILHYNMEDPQSLPKSAAETSKEVLNDYKPLMSLEDVCQLFGVSRATIYRWEEKKYFRRCSPEHASVQFKKSDIEAYINSDAYKKKSKSHS